MSCNVTGNWRKAIGLFLTIAMVVVMSACGGTETGSNNSNQSSESDTNEGNQSEGDQSQELTLKFSWYLPEGTIVDEHAKSITDKINENSKGSIKVETYPGGSLLTESETGKGLQNNVVQMAIMGIHWWSGEEPATNFDMIPGLMPTDPEEALSKLRGKAGDTIKEMMEPHEVTIAGWGFYGYFGSYINNKHEVVQPEDLKGLQLRANGDFASEQLRHFGATPVNMDSSEVYQALSYGTVDGASSGLSSFISRKWIETAKYITAAKLGIYVYPVFVNSEWWNNLTEDQRRIISDSIAETKDDHIESLNNVWDKNIKEAEQAGAEIVRIDNDHNEDILEDWLEKTAFMKDYYIDQTGDNGKKIVESFESDN